MGGFTKEDQLRGKKPKNLGKIKQVSNDAARRTNEYRLVLDEISQERDPWCEECRAIGVDNSHLIPRAFNDYAYMCVPENIRYNCRHHHTSWECGNLWLLPKMGLKYLRIVQSLNEQYYLQKVAQFRKNLERYKEKNWLAISNGTIVIPEWVDEFFTTFDKQ
jgi:hypothetical protein